MSLKRKILVYNLLFHFTFVYSQKVSGVYKIDGLLNRINSSDTLYIVNFWATWCKPCVQELPAFDSLNLENKKSKIKILLVCLDFKEDLLTKVNPFLSRKNVQAECVLLDEVNGNEFVNKINPKWSGAIPATLFKKNKLEIFEEKKLTLGELKKRLEQVK